MAKATTKTKKEKDIVIFTGPKGDVTLRGDVEQETIWATLAEMAGVFGVNSQAITKHIRNIYKELELEESSTCSKMEQVQTEGKRRVVRNVNLYNLDVIIAMGYRINSVAGTRFRQWATATLRQQITKGFTINRTQVGAHYDEFMQVIHIFLLSVGLKDMRYLV